MSGILMALEGAEGAEGGGGGGGNEYNVRASPPFLDSIGQLSNNCTGTVTGGASPLTYQWQKITGDNITATAKTSATTQFSTFLNGQQQATFRLAVQDNDGKIAHSNDVTVILNFTNE